LVRVILAMLALVAIVAALWHLEADLRGIDRDSDAVGDTPVSIYRAAGLDSGPLVVIAHGFAGSRPLMEPFALTFARAGYVAVSYDFRGHGRHPRPLSGELGDQEGTPALLIEQTREVVEFALGLPQVDGRLAVLGHSMATNILVRYAQKDERVQATVGVSMFAPTIDEDSPANLLAMAGSLEGRLVEEGRRVVALAQRMEPEDVEAFTTYGSLAEGRGRRLVVSPRVEHVGVLYSSTSLDEARRWLDGVFGMEASDVDGLIPRGEEVRPGAEDPQIGPSGGWVSARGRWLALLFGALLVLAWPLSALLPRSRTVDTAVPDPGAPQSRRPSPAPGAAERPSWKLFALLAGLPALLTPLLLTFIPTDFLPVVVGDYVAVHFGVYGLLTGGLLWWRAGRPSAGEILGHGGLRGPTLGRTLLGAGLIFAFFLAALAWPIDRYFTSFMPIGARMPLILAVLAGTLPYFVADEWLTRRAQPLRGAYPLTKFLFLVSLGLAVALDFEGLFFLIIIVPVIVLFFIVHGLFSRWAFHQTGSPLVAGLANAAAFAWALGVTFPLYAGA
jgi:dienelactone hydrolase